MSVSSSYVATLSWAMILSVCLATPPREAHADQVMVANFQEARKLPPPPWEVDVHEGESNITYVEDGAGQALRLRSDPHSSFAIQREVEVDLEATPYLVWEWKVTEVPERGDFTDPARDDQAAQLIVVLSKDGMLESRKVISYVWDGGKPQGTMGDAVAGEHIPLLEVKAVVVESGAEKAGLWLTEVRNVLEDCRRLYGEEPQHVVAVRIQINSQHTDSEAEAFWRSVRFTDAPPRRRDGAER